MVPPHVMAMMQKEADDRLKDMERRKDEAYTERNQCVKAFALCAKLLGWPVYRGLHDANDASWSRDWLNIIFIETPSGQASWHFHDSHMYLFEEFPLDLSRKWDGHTTAEKYERITNGFVA